ncbi:hypothetical protein [Ensifer sp. 4252]|uniref:hypothetical protein n=1 Tax=Ensifer sp. 4252 TaxID=3373915 RepID=UPI003D2489EB
MNQREEFKEKPLIDPVTGQPTPMPTDPAPVRSGRSSWPLVIILLAGLVLALIAWLPAELTRDSAETAKPPATTDQSTTGQTATPPATDTTTAPSGGTMTAPETTPQQGTTPPATNGTTQPAPAQ